MDVTDRLRVGRAALKIVFECSLATANCASKAIFALRDSSSLDLDCGRCRSEYQKRQDGSAFSVPR
jgi:hypothetical protein